MFTAQEIREIIETYGKFPDTPAGYEDPVAFRGEIDRDEYFIAVSAANDPIPTILQGRFTAVGGKRLVVTRKKPRYRYVCDDLTLRIPKDGDWIAAAGGSVFSLITIPWSDTPRNKVLIFRREEY